jgi:triphosphatase
MAENEVEVEWQFDALDLRPVERWLAALPLRPPGGLPRLTAQAKPPRRLTDRYLDTDDWRIGRAGLVLRTRRRGRHDEATLKDRQPAGSGGLRERLEISEALPAAGLPALGSDGPVGWRLAAVAGRRPLRQVLEVRTRRRPFSLRIGGEEVAEVALDDTVVDVGPGQPPVRLRRVEVEVVPRWVDDLEPLVRDLRTASGLQPATLSKFEAGLLALGVTIPGPPDLGPTEVAATSTLGDLAYAVLRRHLAVLLAKEPGTRLGEDIEELHDMRVATRRLRAAIDLFADAFPVRARGLRDELSWLAAVLGRVRDLDVQIDNLDDMVPATAAAPLEHLRHLLQREHRVARRALLEALDSPRWERLAAGLVGLARQGPNRRSAAARQPAALAVPELVLVRHRAVVKAARRARRSELASDFHRLRIRCKRLRYSLEFVAGVYGGRTERYTRRLAKIQDALGLMQDAEVATRRLHELATTGDLPPATVFVMGGAAERYDRRATDLQSTMGRRLDVLDGKDWTTLAGTMERRRTAAEAARPSPLPASVPPARPVGPENPVGPETLVATDTQPDPVLEVYSGEASPDDRDAEVEAGGTIEPIPAPVTPAAPAERATLEPADTTPAAPGDGAGGGVIVEWPRSTGAGA